MTVHTSFTIREHGACTDVAAGQLPDGRFWEMTWDGRQLRAWLEGVACDPYLLCLSAGV